MVGHIQLKLPFTNRILIGQFIQLIKVLMTSKKINNKLQKLHTCNKKKTSAQT